MNGAPPMHTLSQQPSNLITTKTNSRLDSPSIDKPSPTPYAKKNPFVSRPTPPLPSVPHSLPSHGKLLPPLLGSPPGLPISAVLLGLSWGPHSCQPFCDPSLVGTS